MIKSNKMLIWEIALIIAIIAIIVSIFTVQIDLGVFKITSPQKLIESYDSLKDMNMRVENTKTKYDTSLIEIESVKKQFENEKEKYESISDESIQIIKEAIADEKYNIDYIWITLGNYALANNLQISLVEPGGSDIVETKKDNTKGGAEDDKTDNKETQLTNQSEKPDAEETTPIQSSRGNELSIKVVGNYINVSSFIFELENDVELRFKLDNIKMTYAGDNNITATFSVKNLKFKK